MRANGRAINVVDHPFVEGKPPSAGVSPPQSGNPTRCCPAMHLPVRVDRAAVSVASPSAPGGAPEMSQMSRHGARAALSATGTGGPASSARDTGEVCGTRNGRAVATKLCQASKRISGQPLSARTEGLKFYRTK